MGKPTLAIVGLDLRTRFWAKVASREPAACWRWRASVNRYGYGRIATPGQVMTGAHVVSYVMHNGPVPDGHEVHHTCRQRDCVNPHHLRAVTHMENCSPQNSSAAEVNRQRLLAMTHCKRGHEFTPTNTHVRPSGARRCRACDADRARQARRNRRG